MRRLVSTAMTCLALSVLIASGAAAASDRKKQSQHL